jgi:DNA-directed RNA polymerase subunit M/transcription elongation factor TFIIS
VPDETIVFCKDCQTVLAEPPDTKPEKRSRCPKCGSKAREFHAAGIVASSAVSASVEVRAVGASAEASAPSPQVLTEQLEDAGFDVQWLQLTDNGAWLVRIFDRQGECIDMAANDDSQDAILAVIERLLPNSQKPK